MHKNNEKFLVLIGNILLLSVLFLSCRQVSKDPYQIEQSLLSDSAMVVSAHPLASEIGASILAKGGNAVDAAVATQFALAVVYPRAGNIGGGGFMVLRMANGESNTLDYREKAPSSAYEDMYLDQEKEVIDSLSMYGHLASGVPGSVDGLITAWKKYGNIKDFSRLIEPAISLAKNGFRINDDEAKRLEKYKSDLVKHNDHFFPFVKKEKWQAGDLIIQEELAHTLSIIKENGISGFYEGEVASIIDSQMRVHRALITKEDLKAYKSIWRKPINTSYKNYKLISMAPPSSGGIALAQLLEILENYDLEKMGMHSSMSMHLMVEAERRVYADRAKHLGDADYYPVPIDSLLDPEYLLKRMKDYSPDTATLSASIEGGDPLINLESFETTHTSVIDKDRMAVSVTTTLNSNYGSKVYMKGAGFFLNNEMDDFSIKPGVANQFGLIGGKANAIEAGKRMLSSMTPTIIEKDDRLFMVLGTPGGSTIITSVLQVFLNVAEYGLTMTEAVEAPRFHHQWLPDNIFIEERRFKKQLVEELEDKGHKFDTYKKIGLIKAILVRDDNKLEGAGDPRSFDDVEGY